MTLDIGPNLWDGRSSTNDVGSTLSAGQVPVPRLRVIVGFLQAGKPPNRIARSRPAANIIPVFVLGSVTGIGLWARCPRR